MAFFSKGREAAAPGGFKQGDALIPFYKFPSRNLCGELGVAVCGGGGDTGGRSALG